MSVQLVRVKTADGLPLDGALHPGRGTASPLWFDGVLLLHGVGGTFYGSSLMQQLAVWFAELGLATVCVNTRGHDSVYLTTTDGGPRRLGAACECVDECRLDIEAWLGLLAQHGCQRVLLWGHSLGAIKAVYSQAHQPSRRVAGICALSPPRLSAQAFASSPASAAYHESLLQSQQLVDDGQGDALLDVKFPFPMVMSASTYTDKYGDERYNIVRLIDRLRAPALVTYGALELEDGGVAFGGLPQALAEARRDGQPLQVGVVPEADHAYTGRHDAVFGKIRTWLLQRGKT